MSLSAEEILAAQDRGELTKASVPEWGKDGHVYIGVMTGGERDSYEGSQVRQVGKTVQVNLNNRRAELLVRCLCDKDGKRLFRPNQVTMLALKNSLVLDRLHKVALRVNAIEDEDVKDLEKNLPSEPSADAGSD
jgi:hypothetical protein